MANEAKREPIAIIGSGCRFPGGASTPSKLWNILCNPHDLRQDIPRERFDVRSLHDGMSTSIQGYFLSEEHRHFDYQFFKCSPLETETIDPQHRLLLECVYEAIESAGLVMENLRGSSTGVYVGMTSQDYGNIINREIQQMPRYAATGTFNNMISNRVSYFFDWRGPSMTIDTACSSSLVAVHQAVQALRNDESEIAVACGANLILDSGRFIPAVNMGMLSPTGRCHMWDSKADGFARGEGIAAVVLKPLKKAIRDGDHIECVIRETGVNQDGRTPGIAMPNAHSQQSLICNTYSRAGLDIKDQWNRCQYFEAHGTGTNGDAKEAEAISSAFFAPDNEKSASEFQPLYVGSIKTIMGHSEGCAGIAGLLKASLAIQNACVPPNFGFESLHPNVQPWCSHLSVPISVIPWPELPQGVPRRASVNSFGFGGTNSHVIIEQFVPPVIPHKPNASSLTMPFVFSANSEQSLRAMIQDYVNFIENSPKIDLRDLSWTLYSRRSVFPIRTYLSASNVNDLSGKLIEKMRNVRDDPSLSVGTRCLSPSSKPRVLGIFTGQGAQWAGMGRKLMSLPFAQGILDSLDKSLADLPETDRPCWSLATELQADDQLARIHDPTVSQPLHAAIQIILVDLLRHAGVKLNTVVGHSSGEIVAAYTAGFLSASDAIRIAYYRGKCTRIASAKGLRGGMIAARIPVKEALDIIELSGISERVKIAAINSPSSVTLSGDMEEIEIIQQILKRNQKTSKVLNIDMAYHSHHMQQPSEEYLHSLHLCNITILSPTEKAPSWFSSVDGFGKMTSNDGLEGGYWAKNMLETVNFDQAVSNAADDDDKWDIGIEIGAHPMLMEAVAEILDAKFSKTLPRTGVMKNKKDELETLSDAFGFIWAYLGPSAVDLAAYNDLLFQNDEPSPKLVKNLPAYPWDQNRVFWKESRRSRFLRTQAGSFHSFLGLLSPESTEDERRWTNFLTPGSLSWMKDPYSQKKKQLPSLFGISMVLEASVVLAEERRIGLIIIDDLHIHRPVTFENNSSEVETLFVATINSNIKSLLTISFKLYAMDSNQSGLLPLVAKGSVRIMMDISVDMRSDTGYLVTNFQELDLHDFHNYLSRNGYQHRSAPKQLSTLKSTSHGVANKKIINNSSQLSPKTIDVMTLALLTASWTTNVQPGLVPKRIECITVNPSGCKLISENAKFISTTTSHSGRICGNINILENKSSSHTLIRMEGIDLEPLSQHNTPLPPVDATIVENQAQPSSSVTSSVRDMIVGAYSKEAAINILSSALFKYIRHILQLSDEDKEEELKAVPLIELGIDSLLAMEIRSWFKDEVMHSVSILDILGGLSTMELASSTIEKIRDTTHDSGNLTDAINTMPVILLDSSVISQTSGSSNGISTPALSSGSSVLSSCSRNLFESEEQDLEHSSKVTTPQTENLLWVGPLSRAQSRYWFINCALEDKTALNVSFYIYFTGKLHVPFLEKAVKILGERHESLRTCFIDNSNGMPPMQGITEHSCIHFEQKSISGKDELDAEYEQLKNHIYDLRYGPIMKMILLTESSSSNYLLFGYHHLTMDGFSFQQVFLPELEKLYSQLPLQPCIRQFREHSEIENNALRENKMQKEIEFWKNKFSDLPAVLPLPPMSRATSRTSLRQYEHHQVNIEIDASTTSKIKALCKSFQVSTFHFYVTIYEVLLFKMLKIEDICIGIADANRIDKEDTGVIGLYLNFLPLRFHLTSSQKFPDLLRTTRKMVFEALENSCLPFDTLLDELHVPRSTKHSPLFQAFVNYRSAQAEKGTFADLQSEIQDVQITQAAYDLGLDIGENPAGITRVAFITQSSLYSQSDTEMVQRSYMELLETFLQEPTRRLQECSAYHSSDIQNALDLGRGKFLVSRWPETLVHKVQEIMKTHGSRVAVKDSLSTFTYAQLETKYTSIARAILQQGIRTGQRIAVFQEPTVDWICSLLAIMHIGGVYVPLDLRNPPERLGMIIDVSNPAAILVHSATVERTTSLRLGVTKVINISDVSESEVNMPIPIIARSASPAVILFTSGSTGTPKGISLAHSALHCGLESLIERLDLDQQITLQHSAYSFDISMAQIFVGLTTGGTVYVAGKLQRGDPVALAEVISKEAITFFMSTPSEISSIIRYGSESMKFSSLQRLVCGGEPFFENLKEDFQKMNLPQLRVFNGYGPAETTITATYMEISYRGETINDSNPAAIGFPLSNYSVYIVDDDLNPVPIGVPGEILIGGGAVAMGYLDEELTKTRFIKDRHLSPTFQSQGWQTVFRTGDRGRLRPDGALTFEGRVEGDTLIKMRGLRIDLEDIENTILAAAKNILSEVAVSVRGDPQFLVSHVVFSPQADQIKEFQPDSFINELLLRLPLPPYMIPAIMVHVDALPITIHGKRDRKAISALPLEDDGSSEGEDCDSDDSDINEELNEMEATLWDIWESILPFDVLNVHHHRTGGSKVDPNISFFQIGGNSSLLPPLQARIRDEFGVSLPVTILMEACSEGLTELAETIQAAQP